MPAPHGSCSPAASTPSAGSRSGDEQESGRSDRSPTLTPPHGGRSSARLERQVVALEVGGSSPLGHPVGGRVGSSAACASSSMAEQRTLNPQILGSNPRGRTTLTCGCVVVDHGLVTVWSRNFSESLPEH